MPPETFDTLLDFFKALSNESRLKIVGILANGERTVSELAAMLDLREPTVSQHLDLLKQVGLVNVRPHGNYRYYSFDSQALINLSKSVFSQEGLAALAKQFEDVGDAYERKVFQTFCDGDRIVRLPSSDKKFLVLLKWLADQFETGREYTEKEVNEILLRHHEDYALLRRELVDRRYMQRAKGIYWKLPPPAPETTP